MTNLPCPFCGTNDLIFEYDEIHSELVCLRCNVCGASPGYCGSKDETAKVWNTRHQNANEQRLLMSEKSEDTTLFSGIRSEQMWADIDKAQSVHDLRDILYLVCCQLQTLEYKLSPLFEKSENE